METEQLRREVRLFKMSKRTNNPIHRNSFRKVRLVFAELLGEEREQRKEKHQLDWRKAA